jgi:hypothetical protein
MGHSNRCDDAPFVSSEDGRLFAAKLGRLLSPQENLRLPMPAGNV